jgi:hypothetical protein
MHLRRFRSSNTTAHRGRETSPLPSLRQTDDLRAQLGRVQQALAHSRFSEADQLLHPLVRRVGLLAEVEYLSDAPSAAASQERIPTPEPLPEPSRPIYHTNVAFVAALMARLLPAEQEMGLTGTRLSPNRFTLDSGVPLPGEASAVHVTPNPAAVADMQDYFWACGQSLYAIAHSHPGDTPRSCHPSPTDRKTHGELETAGFPLIGLIVVPGYVCAWSVNRPFELAIEGSGYEVVEGAPTLTVYRLDPALYETVRKLGGAIAVGPGRGALPPAAHPRI